MVNKQGGISPNNSEEMKRAADVDLITLPRKVTGTNCFNCRFVQRLLNNEIGYCTHKEVQQYVNQHNCCAEWDNKDAYRPFDRNKDATNK